MRILLICMQSRQSVRVKGLLMGVNPATNKHEVSPFVSNYLLVFGYTVVVMTM